MSIFERPEAGLIPNGIHHLPIEDGRLLPNFLKNGKAKAIHFSTLEKIRDVLQCQLGDILTYDKDASDLS